MAGVEIDRDLEASELMFNEDKVKELKDHLAVIADLQAVKDALEWDQRVMMPDGGTQSRSDQLATISHLLHERQTHERLGELLEELYDQQVDLDSVEAGIVRFNWREYRKAAKIPPGLMADFNAATSLATEGWFAARTDDDFTLFRPHLEKLIDLQQQIASYLKPDSENPYDALLDYFEAGLTYDLAHDVLSALKPRLASLIETIAEYPPIDDSVLRRFYAESGQLSFAERVIGDLGLDFTRSRFDLFTHPVTTSITHEDVRLTTRVNEEYLPDCLMTTIHETGHSLHYQRLSSGLYRSRLNMVGPSVTESQARFYENHIGRSGAYWSWYFPILQEYFPGVLDDVDVSDFYRALNTVKPSLIRVNADEVTYGMHVMLRFELEDALLNGRLAVKDLPDAWNSFMEEYLGVVPPNDTKGVLQDIHWAAVQMGYFPTYVLGSIFAAQLWDALVRDQPDSEDRIASGDFSTILAWLTDNVMQHGALYTLPELADRIAGGFSAEPFISYLHGKYSAIYNF